MNIVERLRPIALGSLAAIALTVVAVAEPPGARHFVAHLEGGQEVPARETNATGQAIFKLSEDETEIQYRLIVANIDNVTASHIHLGVAGVNGGVVVFLAGDFPPGGGRVPDSRIRVRAAGQAIPGVLSFLLHSPDHRL